MTKIQAADAQAMDNLFQGVCKSAGIVDKEAPANTDQAFKDHEAYIAAVEGVLSEDKTESFDPNDPILD